MSDSTTTSRRFFSLKWRTLLLLSLLLVFINALLNLLAYVNLNEQFESQMSQSVKNTSSSLLEQSRMRLVELGGSIVLASQSLSGGELTDKDVRQYIDENWELFQIDWGIETVSIYSVDSIKQQSWGHTAENNRLPRFIQKAAETLEPLTVNLCEVECRLYAAMPLLLANGDAKILLLSTTLVDFILQFSRQNDVGVALVRRQSKKAILMEKPLWGYRIAALTHMRNNLPLLGYLAETTSLEEFLDGGVSLMTAEGRYTYFYGIPLEPGPKQNDNLIIMISDVTSQHESIVSNLIQALSISLLGLVTSLMVLLLVLWRPMKRIHRLAAMLPMLAKSGFEEVRNQLSGQPLGRYFADELDVLENTTRSLTHQLEDLEQEVKQRTSELENMALYDDLTGLANRRLFTDQLIGLISEFKRYGERFAVVFIDLDNFKAINDTLGHEAGDELLQEVAKRLGDSVRSTDTVARIGGDEFTLLLPQITESQHVVDLINKVLLAFQDPIKVADTETSAVTPSIGIAMGPENGLDAQELMRCADQAMYQAKQEGKNTYHFYTEAMNQQAQDIVRLENQLTLALTNQQFVFYYQPVIDLNSGKIVSLEALLRWQQTDGRIVEPVHFLDTMINSGQISVLTSAIVSMACHCIEKMQALDVHDIPVTVNLCAQQIDDPKLIETLTQAIEDNNLPPHLLRFEISEADLMANAENRKEFIVALQRLGLSLTIDNFGRGVSSINQIAMLPAVDLKIDSALMESLASQGDQSNILSAITAMAQQLDLRVIGKGIETSEQIQFLKECHCDAAQGMFFEAPTELQALEKVLLAPQLPLSKTTKTHLGKDFQ